MHLTLKAHVETADITTQTIGDKTYTVVPVVAAIARKVMNGVYYPPDVWEWSLASWNGRPIVIDHPVANDGTYLSANSPDILNQIGIGHLFDVTYEEGKFKGNMWLDQSLPAVASNAAAPVIFTNINDGKMLEVSTSMFVEGVEDSGSIDGEAYTLRAINIWPDHLAILSNGIGACSIDDGCGAPRANEERNMKGKNKDRKTTFHLEGNEASFNEIRRLLETAVFSEGYVWVADVWPDRFVYEVESFEGAIKLYERTYELNAEQTAVTNLGERVEVVPRKVYEPVVINRGSLNPVLKPHIVRLYRQIVNFIKGEDGMNHLDKLVEMGFDREALESLPARQVELIYNKLAANEGGDEPAAADPAPEPQTPPAQALTLPNELTELAEFIKAAGGAKAFAESLGAANQLAASQRTARERRIAYLANLDSVPLAAEELALLPDAALAKLGNTRPVNYAGLGFNISEPDTGEDYEPAGEYRANVGVRIPKNGTVQQEAKS